MLTVHTTLPPSTPSIVVIKRGILAKTGLFLDYTASLYLGHFLLHESPEKHDCAFIKITQDNIIVMNYDYYF